ncbi:MAG TPA: DUF202 domain-containing protein [Gemmatimonadales bacterium]|nr:DUF202 domain-containing protein [Gemmatimonadales bacterium]
MEESKRGPAGPSNFAKMEGNDIEVMSAELSSRRTGLSFQRTRMSADRTLMSILRTCLSLIGFGFTIFQFFRSVAQSNPGLPARAALRFGLAMVLIGVALLFLGIIQDIRFMRSLRQERLLLVQQGYLHGEEPFQVSVTFLSALLVLLLGLVAILSMVFRVGPLH